MSDETVLACFYKGEGLVNLAVRETTRRPGQALDDVPSHCALIVPTMGRTYYTLYEMTARGWVKREPALADFDWAYPVALPNLPACRAWCEGNQGRYRWWVDGVIGLMALKLVRHKRVGPFFARWHLAYRHICSLDFLRGLKEGGWIAPAWLVNQECPASPNDCLWAIRPKETHA